MREEITIKKQKEKENKNTMCIPFTFLPLPSVLGVAEPQVEFSWVIQPNSHWLSISRIYVHEKFKGDLCIFMLMAYGRNR